ncbi:hypothetical protein SAMN05192533_102280 [Mesobacillus persicus]|uniref:Uncharacterized protein n=1 Tax=Mesobacillus persicus TaxID=930146 RepID=A0A1H7XMP5_9BACI|nr:hypothetical protein [Mesobacillus persicus]SEM35050.1 hypothetical protein SAMN05192533_102280 [Mesobacillus persicus]
MFKLKKDANGVSFSGGTTKIVEEEISATNGLVNHTVNVPTDAYAFVVKQAGANIKVTINGGEAAQGITLFDGDYVGDFVDTIKSFEVSTPASEIPLILQFIV